MGHDHANPAAAVVQKNSRRVTFGAYQTTVGGHSCAMPLTFLDSAQFGFLVGRTPWSAADALVGLLGLDEVDCVSAERVQGDPRGSGGPARDHFKSSSIGEN
jgi:hypothetical protein